MINPHLHCGFETRIGLVVHRYLLAKQIVPQNRFHICTADSKLGAAQCDAHLAVHPVATTASTPVPASSNEVNESANHAAAELALGIDTN